MSTYAEVYQQIDNAVVTIPGCTSGPGSSCPLASFQTYIKKRGEAVGDFVEMCGLQDVKNATSELDIFTNFPSASAQTSMLSVPLPYANAQ